MHIETCAEQYTDVGNNVLDKDEEMEQNKIADNVINFLMRIAASIHDSSNVNSAQCDMYVRRCLDLLASAMSKQVWGLSEGSGVQVIVAFGLIDIYWLCW